MVLISGYVCIYSRTSTLIYLSRLLQAVLKEEGAFSGFDVSVRGKINFKKKQFASSEIGDFFSNRYKDGLNLLVTHGECGFDIGDGVIGKITISLLPSPLDEIWSPIGKNFPKSKSHTQNLTLNSLASHEGFVSGRKIEEYPNLYLIYLETKQAVSISPEQLHQFGNALAESLHGVDRWSGILDAGNYIPPISTGEMLLANPDTVARMDKFFIAPHLTLLGGKELINSYTSEMGSNFPEVTFLKTNSKDVGVLSLNEWEDRRKIFSPKWHENSWA